MLFGKGPVESAAEEAVRSGLCPIEHLDRLATEHWGADELCGLFSCAECAGAGWGGPPQGGDDAASEIGF